MTRFRAAATLAVVIAGLLAGCSSAPAPSSPAGMEIPLTVAKASGAKRATIAADVANTPVQLLFDTGSSGLTLFASSAPDELAKANGAPFQQAYAGGVAFSGIETLSAVAVAGIPSAAPIAIRVVQSVSCAPQVPDCVAAGGLAAVSKSIGADGIFGAGLWAEGDVYSPLLQLDLPAPAAISVSWDGSEGKVELLDTVPDGASVPMPPAQVNVLPDGAPAWDNGSVALCWQIADATRTCIPTSFDTGATATSFPVGFPGASDSDIRRLPVGQTITATESGSDVVFLSLTTGRQLARNLVTVIPDATTANTGIGLFSRYEVVFSLGDGLITLIPSGSGSLTPTG